MSELARWAPSGRPGPEEEEEEEEPLFALGGLACPVCRGVFEDPVVTVDGQSYCRKCIAQWFRLYDRHVGAAGAEEPVAPLLAPATQQPLMSRALLGNAALRGLVAAYWEACPVWAARDRERLELRRALAEAEGELLRLRRLAVGLEDELVRARAAPGGADGGQLALVSPSDLADARRFLEGGGAGSASPAVGDLRAEAHVLRAELHRRTAELARAAEQLAGLQRERQLDARNDERVRLQSQLEAAGAELVQMRASLEQFRGDRAALLDAKELLSRRSEELRCAAEAERQLRVEVAEKEDEILGSSAMLARLKAVADRQAGDLQAATAAVAALARACADGDDPQRPPGSATPVGSPQASPQGASAAAAPPGDLVRALALIERGASSETRPLFAELDGLRRQLELGRQRHGELSAAAAERLRLLEELRRLAPSEAEAKRLRAVSERQDRDARRLEVDLRRAEERLALREGAPAAAPSAASAQAQRRRAGQAGEDGQLRLRLDAALTDACMRGQAEAVQALVSAGADARAVAEDGVTPLHTACVTGHSVLVDVLCDAGAVKDARDGEGFTPIYVAALAGHAGVVKRLLAKRADAALSTRAGDTPLDVALTNGHSDVEMVLRGAVDSTTTRPRPAREASPDVSSLLAAVRRGDLDEVAALCAKPRGALDQVDDRGRTPLFLAALLGHARIVDRLFAAGASVNAANDEGDTPGHAASHSGKSEALKALCLARADVNAANGAGLTPLMVAAYKGEVEVCRLLCGERADLHRQDEEGWSALYSACRQGHAGIVRLLVEARGDPGLATLEGRTPLDAARALGDGGQILQLLGPALAQQPQKKPGAWGRARQALGGAQALARAGAGARGAPPAGSPPALRGPPGQAASDPPPPRAAAGARSYAREADLDGQGAARGARPRSLSPSSSRSSDSSGP